MEHARSVDVDVVLQTIAKPLTDEGTNSAFLICALLPGSTRTAVTSLDGVTTSTRTTALTLAPLSADTAQFNYNDYFYPFSQGNGGNGAADGTLGLYYYFDNYGIVYQPVGGWQGYTYINLCTGNAAGAGGGVQLMEELPTGQFGSIQDANWKVTVTPVQNFTVCPPTVGDAMVHQYTLNLLYEAQCTSGAAIPGCSAGNSAALNYDSGYYTLNLTLNMLTSTAYAIEPGPRPACTRSSV